MFPFRRLKVWQEAHALTKAVYRATVTVSDMQFPDLRRQLRRTAASMASNIAEGASRDTQAQFAHFLEIAIASASELDYHLLLALELEALNKREGDQLAKDTSRVCRMLIALRRTVKTTGRRMSRGTARHPITTKS